MGVSLTVCSSCQVPLPAVVTGCAAGLKSSPAMAVGVQDGPL